MAPHLPGRTHPSPLEAGPLAPVVDLELAREKRLWAEFKPVVDRLVRQALNRVQFRFSEPELRSAAWLGLLEASLRFDPARGIPFGAFAQHRIAGAILDEIRGADTLARPSRRRSNLMEAIRDRLTRKLHREPTDLELARVLGEDLDTYHQRCARQRAQAFVALEALPPNEAAGIPAGKSPLDELCRAAEVNELLAAVETLPERHQAVLGYYYRDEMSYREIGQLMGVTESRVCQIVKAAHGRIREQLAKCA